MTKRIGLALALSALATLLLATIAMAAPQKAVIQLTVTAASKAADGYVLAVRVRTDDGKPVNEAAVRYYETVDLIGSREMYLGTVTTDGQGQGSLVYLPAQLGSHPVIARFAGRDQISAAEARTTFEALTAAPLYEPESVPLSGFTQVVAMVVGAVVLCVWALIAFALISTARGVRRGARDLGPKGDLA
jgi:hypothetical protein